MYTIFIVLTQHLFYLKNIKLEKICYVKTYL